MVGTHKPVEGAVKPSQIEQYVFENPLFAMRITEIPSNLQMKVDYNLGTRTSLYQGYAPRGLSSGTDGWVIHKFNYSLASFPNQVSERLVAYDNWDNRTLASYA